MSDHDPRAPADPHPVVFLFDVDNTLLDNDKGIRFGEPVTNSRVIGNTANNNTEFGIQFKNGPVGNLIQGNTTIDNGRVGIQINQEAKRNRPRQGEQWDMQGQCVDSGDGEPLATLDAGAPGLNDYLEGSVAVGVVIGSVSSPVFLVRERSFTSPGT